MVFLWSFKSYYEVKAGRTQSFTKENFSTYESKELLVLDAITFAPPLIYNWHLAMCSILNSPTATTSTFSTTSDDLDNAFELLSQVFKEISKYKCGYGF